MSSEYNDNFTSSFPIWISFISFYCLIAITRTSNTTFNRSVQSGHSCLVLDFNEGFQLFTTEYYIGCGFVINSFYYVKVIPIIVRVFIMNGC